MHRAYGFCLPSAARAVPARPDWLQDIVSKHRDRRYIAVRTKEWIKVKNRSHPAMSRGFQHLRWRGGQRGALQTCVLGRRR